MDEILYDLDSGLPYYPSEEPAQPNYGALFGFLFVTATATWFMWHMNKDKKNKK
jgi:hypothetical protein